MCIHCAGQLKRRMIVYAIHSHRSGADDELSFDVGDMIEVIREPGPSDWWCTGRIMSSLDEGLFPVNYVDRTGPKGSSGDLSETTYQALCVDTLNDNQDGDIYKSKEVVTQLLYLTAVALYVVQKGKAPPYSLSLLPNRNACMFLERIQDHGKHANSARPYILITCKVTAPNPMANTDFTHLPISCNVLYTVCGNSSDVRILPKNRAVRCVQKSALW